MQNRARLGHLHHECRLSAREVVARADAREQAIEHPDLGVRCRHEATHVRHQRDQSDLTQDGRLARHVRPRQHDDPRVLRELHIVGNEFVARHHAFDDRMTSGGDAQCEVVGDARPNIAFSGRDFRERHKHVHGSESAGHRVQP